MGHEEGCGPGVQIRVAAVSAWSMSASSVGTACHGSEMGKLSRDKEDAPTSGARMMVMGYQHAT